MDRFVWSSVASDGVEDRPFWSCTLESQDVSGQVVEEAVLVDAQHESVGAARKFEEGIVGDSRI